MLYPEIVDSNEQYISISKAFASDHATADLNDKPGIAVCWAESPYPFWNALFLTEEMNDPVHLKQRLRTSAEYMRTRKHPGLVYVCEDYLRDDAHREFSVAAQEAGLEMALDLFGMRGDILSFKRAESHPELRFERVVDEESLRTYADINSESYGYPLEAGRVALEGSALWKERSFAYIGYLDGKAVSTAAAFENAGQLYLTYVATRPGVARQGLAEATIRRALDAAFKATGLRRTSLHATRSGFSLYDRIGYKWVTRIIAFRPARAG
jgi:ribosomal protein S18 acetylase RimI-like enzyme